MSDTTHDPASPDRTAVVLVIDDVDATRAGLAELLRLRGYEALEAADGAEGLRILRANPRVRVAVVDVMMPGASGYWFREQQLREPAIAHVPVVVFTGLADPGVPPEVLGVAEVLRKPIALDQLLDVIRRYCDLHPAAR
jgi:CheY-like chemotaxis protein